MKLNIESYRPFCRIVCVLLALHFFNLSIDSRDPQPDFVPEDLAINDIESITEFFAEVVFGWDNAFAEHDEKDNEGGGSIDFLKFYFCSSMMFVQHISGLFSASKFHIRNTDAVIAPVKDINSPPPRG